MSKTCGGINRREFMAGVGIAAGGLAMTSLAAGFSDTGEAEHKPAPALPLRIQPVLACKLHRRREQISWRPWGGFHTQQDIDNEKKRIGTELQNLASQAEFGLDLLPLVTLSDREQAAKVAEGDHDVLLLYAANSATKVLESLTNPEKWTIVFVRHKSGPVYLWYEIAHNRYLRKTVDEYGQPGVDYQDVVVDRSDEILWRLRALYGLKNTMGKRIVAVGGPAGWGKGGKNAPEIARNLWKMEIETVDYAALAEMITKARQNTALVKRCNEQAGQYLKQDGTVLRTDKKYVNNAFILNEVFKRLMAAADTDAITINHCMVTIMPISETTACLPLSMLNDSGYTAFCESDFVVIHISARRRGHHGALHGAQKDGRQKP
ncbi:MAG: hypothetical protein ACYSUV_14320 [Planctomycetota bacterium]|jgi:hypothetical protein